MLEQWAELGAAALADVGLPGESVDGIVTSHLSESEIFVPSTVTDTSASGRISPSSSISEEPAQCAWCGARPPRSSWESATWCCARYPRATSPRPRRRSPSRWWTRCSSVRRATSSVLRRRNSRFRTATSVRTARTVRSPNGMPRSTDDERAMAKIVADQRFNAKPHRGRDLERHAADGRRGAGQPGHRRPAAHARDRDAVRRGRRCGGRQCRRRGPVDEPSGVDQGVR